MDKKVVSFRAKSDVEQLRSTFATSDSELDKNIGRQGFYTPTGSLYERKVIILGIQKAWGHNQKGEYVFGIPAYTVQQIEPFIDKDGEKFISDIPFVANASKIKIIEED